MILLAMDRKPSVRSFDADGRLRVAVSPISKANVCDYMGREIPGCAALGLDPDKIYKLLRHPDELAKAAETFNNLPILSDHVPVDAFGADSHMADIVVGSTGTDAAIDGAYLTNSLIIWARPSIDGVVNDEKRELSSAYRYTPDMTPGNYEGVDYDGVMRDIVGNHVALVIEGRAGSDVIVGDEQPMVFKSKRAMLLAGGLTGLIRPLLAQDAKFDMPAALQGVSAKSLAKNGAPKALADRVFGLVQPMLAADADLDVDAVCKVIDAVNGTASTMTGDNDMLAEPGMEPKPMAGDADGGGLMEFLKGKLSDEDYAEAVRMSSGDAMDGYADEDDAAMDADDMDDDDKKDKPAMDANRFSGRRVLAEVAAIRTAEREVQPVVGELVAMDSAAAVYKVGLEALGVDTAKLHSSSFAETFRAVNAAREGKTSIAQDVRLAPTARSDFDKRFPNRMNLIRG